MVLSIIKFHLNVEYQINRYFFIFHRTRLFTFKSNYIIITLVLREIDK